MTCMTVLIDRPDRQQSTLCDPPVGYNVARHVTPQEEVDCPACHYVMALQVEEALDICADHGRPKPRDQCDDCRVISAMIIHVVDARADTYQTHCGLPLPKRRPNWITHPETAVCSACADKVLAGTLGALAKCMHPNTYLSGKLLLCSDCGATEAVVPYVVRRGEVTE